MADRRPTRRPSGRPAGRSTGRSSRGSTGRRSSSSRPTARQVAGTVKSYKMAEKRQTRLRVIAIIVLLILLIIIAMSSFRLASMSSLRDGSKSFWSRMGPGKGYPYQLNSSDVDSIGVLNGDIFVLENNKTMTLNTTAKEVKNVKHSYARPAMSIASDRALVYDRAGTRYRVENRTDIIAQGKLHSDEQIITGAVGKKGNIAFGTLCNDATSRLVVYNSTYKKRIFVWDCAEYTISSVALSDNGKYAAVSVIGSENAEEYSKIFIFDFDYSEPIFEGEYLGNTLIAVHFTDNNNVAAVGDNGLVFVKDLRRSQKIQLNDSTLSAFAFGENGDTITVQARYGSVNTQQLVGYRPSGKEDFRVDYDEQIKALAVSHSRIGVLTSNTVDLYGYNGYLHKKVSADSNSIKPLLVGNKVYVYEMGSIVKAHHVSRKS